MTTDELKLQTSAIAISAWTNDADPPREFTQGRLRVVPGFADEIRERWAPVVLRQEEERVARRAAVTIFVEKPWKRKAVDPDHIDTEILLHRIACALAMLGVRVNGTLYSSWMPGLKSMSVGSTMYFQPPVNGHMLVSHHVLVHAVRLARRMEAANKRKTRRFDRAITSLQKGFYEADLGDRMHYFVRAIEGCFPPPLSNVKGVPSWLCSNGGIFKRAAQFLAKERSGAAAPKLASVLWKVRSKVEHLEDLEDLQGAGGLRKRDPMRHFDELAMKAELLASHVVTHVLRSPELFALQGDVDAYRDAMRDDQRMRALWGEPLDVQKAYKAAMDPNPSPYFKVVRDESRRHRRW